MGLKTLNAWRTFERVQIDIESSVYNPRMKENVISFVARDTISASIITLQGHLPSSLNTFPTIHYSNQAYLSVGV